MSDNVVVVETISTPQIVEVNTGPASIQVTTPANPSLVELTAPGQVVLQTIYSTQVVEITNNPANIQVTVSTEPNLVELTAVGPQGPIGPQGPQGIAGQGAFFRYDNTVPNGTWVVSHNLGRVPNVQVFSTSGELIHPDLVVTSQTITVTFAAATAGFLIAL